MKGPANEKNLGLMMELLDAAPATRLCYVAYIGMVVTLIATVVTGVTPLPLWMVIFTVLPVFLAMAPARIIGTLHISAAASMLAWLILV